MPGKVAEGLVGGADEGDGDHDGYMGGLDGWSLSGQPWRNEGLLYYTLEAEIGLERICNGFLGLPMLPWTEASR